MSITPAEGLAGNKSLPLLYAAWQVEETALVVCHMLSHARHLPAGGRVQARGAACGSYWTLGQNETSWLLPCRQEATEKAKSLHATGQVKEAATASSQSVIVTPVLAHELVVQLQRLDLEYIVSPYNADSQLTHLSLVRPSAAVAPVLPWACGLCH